MIATATPWKATDRPDSWARTYFNTPHGERRVIAEVNTDPVEGRVWFIAWRITGARDRWGNEIREVITRGSYALIPGAAAVAKARASRAASAAARIDATDYYRRAMARALERVAAARALLDATELTEYRTLAARQDELTQLTAELAEVERHMLALAA
jgi:hypothetical protein